MTRTVLRPALVAAFFVFSLLTCPAPSQSGRLTFGRPLKTIVLDPGHGGNDSGAKGPGGTMEKDITLSIARLAAELCGKEHRVVLTRTDDYRVELPDRTAIANHLAADLLISIHTGGSFLLSAQNLTVYFYDSAEETPDTSEKTFAPPALSMNTRETIPWDRQQDRYRENSRRLGMVLQESLSKIVHPAADRLQGLPLVVLQGAGMPAVLIELGHMSNPSEGLSLTDPDDQAAVAEAICSGVNRFLEQYEN